MPAKEVYNKTERMYSMEINELILKYNMVIEGYETKYYKGANISVTDISTQKVEECYVAGIKFYPKNSNFVKKHGLMIGCYVVDIANSSEDYCMGNKNERAYMIMEDVVAMVVFKQ